MNILGLIHTLETYAKVNPVMDVTICKNVSKEGLLVNRNFIFNEAADGMLILISPKDRELAERLRKEEGNE